MFHFYIPWKRQKTKGFLTFSGGIEMKHWTKMDLEESEKTSGRPLKQWRQLRYYIGLYRYKSV